MKTYIFSNNFQYITIAYIVTAELNLKTQHAGWVCFDAGLLHDFDAVFAGFNTGLSGGQNQH